jgi:hypothetical protein
VRQILPRYRTDATTFFVEAENTTTLLNFSESGGEEKDDECKNGTCFKK